MGCSAAFCGTHVSSCRVVQSAVRAVEAVGSPQKEIVAVPYSRTRGPAADRIKSLADDIFAFVACFVELSAALIEMTSPTDRTRS